MSFQFEILDDYNYTASTKTLTCNGINFQELSQSKLNGKSYYEYAAGPQMPKEKNSVKIQTSIIQDIADTCLKCVVCQDYLKEPVQSLKCMHTFCKSCFDKLFVTNNKKCPYCRVEMKSKRDAKPNKNLNSLIKIFLELSGYAEQSNDSGSIQMPATIPQHIFIDEDSDSNEDIQIKNELLGNKKKGRTVAPNEILKKKIPKFGLSKGQCEKEKVIEEYKTGNYLFIRLIGTSDEEEEPSGTLLMLNKTTRINEIAMYIVDKLDYQYEVKEIEFRLKLEENVRNIFIIYSF